MTFKAKAENTFFHTSYISGFACIWQLWSNSRNMPFTLFLRGRKRKEEGITEKRERGREGSAWDKQLMQSQSTLICVRPNHGILAFWLTLRTAKGQTRAHVSITASHRGINKWVNGVGICKCGQKERNRRWKGEKNKWSKRERERDHFSPFLLGECKDCWAVRLQSLSFISYRWSVLPTLPLFQTIIVTSNLIFHL